jgi:hypothetical protein
VLVCNKEAAAVAAGDSVDVDRWQDAFGEVIDRIAPRFARYEPLRHAAGLMQGMLSGLDRKNCWTIAEHRGQTTPHGMQHLLARAKWNADAVRDDLRSYVVDHLGDPGAILVVDETGDLKKGGHSVGVQRRYTGTAGRIENAQVAVYLTYAAPRGHAFIDRALYLPKSWTTDTDRRTTAGVPADVEFATKPELAADMITRAVEAGVPAGWVAVTRSTEPTRRCVPPSVATAWATSCRSPPTDASSPTLDSSASTRSPRYCRPGRGRSTPPVPAARDTGPTPGPGSRSCPTTPPTTPPATGRPTTAASRASTTC